MTLAETLSGRVTMDRDEAAKLYPELLRRNEDPRPGDEDLLRRAMLVLEITPATLLDHLKALSRADQIEREMAKLDEEHRRSVKATNERNEAHLEKERRLKDELDREYCALTAEMSQNDLSRNRLSSLRTELGHLKGGNRSAFGLPPRPEIHRGLGEL